MCPNGSISSASRRCSFQENRSRPRSGASVLVGVGADDRQPEVVGHELGDLGRQPVPSTRHWVRMIGEVTARSTEATWASWRRIRSNTVDRQRPRSSGVVSWSGPSTSGDGRAAVPQLELPDPGPARVDRGVELELADVHEASPASRRSGSRAAAATSLCTSSLNSMPAFFSAGASAPACVEGWNATSSTSPRFSFSFEQRRDPVVPVRCTSTRPAPGRPAPADEADGGLRLVGLDVEDHRGRAGAGAVGLRQVVPGSR
jgi:hypothetical protein